MSLSSRAAEKILLATMEQAIRKGTLHIIMPYGDSFMVKGEQKGKEATWILHDWGVIHAIIQRGDIGLGETYSAARWDSPDLEALFTVFIDNMDGLERYADGKGLSKWWFRIVHYFLRRNSLRGSRDNIRAHYDVGNAFYRLWLDDTMTYSSALYADHQSSLEDAQKSKYQRILDRIDPARSRVLEIGCGWGGFAEAAAYRGHQVTGLTISSEQYHFAKARLEHKAEIRLQDYRHTEGTFDAIASIEMFEAVGKQYWPTYFNTLKRSLAEEGVAMIQTITIKDDIFPRYEASSDYIRHYVFPGGMLPSVSGFKASAEKAGLRCRDVFMFGQDYARTLKEWLVRFEANMSAIRHLGYSDAFIRSWRLYISMCAAGFACGRTDVMQVELVHV